jgi:BED zinc finger
MEEVGSVELTDSTITPTSSKKTQSTVWNEFTKISGSNYRDKRIRAKCNHCGTEYVTDSGTGTSNLKRHLAFFKDRPRDGAETVQGCKQIEQGTYHEKLAEVVLLHGYAFMWANHKDVNNDARFICRNTMKFECLKLYKKHKGIVKGFLESLPGRDCLTTDLWTVWNTDSYLCLIAHCIDNSWNLEVVQ